MYADETGQSHFEDIDLALVAMDYAPPTPPIHVSPFDAAVAYGFLSSPPSWDGGWHPAPRRRMIFYLAGEVVAKSATAKCAASDQAASHC